MTVARHLNLVELGSVPGFVDPTPEEEAFDQFLDDQSSLINGVLDVAGMSFRASYILRSLDPEAYKEALLLYQNDQSERILQNAIDSFVSPIAYYLYMFEHGWDNAHQRLLFLRDAWEATIRIIHALVISEARLCRLDLSQAGFKFSDLLSDKINTLIYNIEKILLSAEAQGHELAVAKLLGVGFSEQLRNLNRLRNDFSHAQAKSELQIATTIDESLGEMVSMLACIDAMRDVVLMRCRALEGAMLRREVFMGPGLTRRVNSVEISRDNIVRSYQSELPYFSPGHILAHMQDTFVCLAPFVHYWMSDNGHTTKIGLLKQSKSDGERLLVFELIGDGTGVNVPRAEFAIHLTEIRSLFGLGPDE